MVKYPQDGVSVCCCYDYHVDVQLQKCVVHCALHIIARNGRCMSRRMRAPTRWWPHAQEKGCWPLPCGIIEMIAKFLLCDPVLISHKFIYRFSETYNQLSHLHPKSVGVHMGSMRYILPDRSQCQPVCYSTDSHSCLFHIPNGKIFYKKCLKKQSPTFRYPLLVYTLCSMRFMF